MFFYILCFIVILCIVGVVSILLLLLGIFFVVCWGRDGEVVGWGVDDWGEGGGGGSGFLVVCVGLGFCCVVMIFLVGFGFILIFKKYNIKKIV